MKVTSITVLENLNDTTDVLLVKFDETESALMFYKYADALKYLNQEVIVDFRDDLYKGKVTRVVNSVTETAKIYTLEETGNFKLFSEKESNESNVTFSDLKDGDLKMNAIMYCTAQEYRSSERTISTWVELTVRDAAFKYMKLRLFDYDKRGSNFVNRYVRADITKSVYGLSTQEIYYVENQPDIPEDVTLSIHFINRYLSTDSELLSLFEQINYFDMAKSFNDTHGYGHSLVEMAFEISVCETYKNLVPGVNWDIVMQALILSHLYVCNTHSTLSRTLQNIVKLSGLKVKNKQAIMHIYDGENDDEDNLTEKQLYYTIKKSVEQLIKVRYWL